MSQFQLQILQILLEFLLILLDFRVTLLNFGDEVFQALAVLSGDCTSEEI
jgi:hypothetical protein